MDEAQYSAFTSDYQTTVKVIFRETICDDPDSSIIMIVAIVAGLIVFTIAGAIIAICKTKKKACFNTDSKIDAVKKHDLDQSENKLVVGDVSKSPSGF